MTTGEVVGSIIGGIVCLGVAVLGGYSLVKCLKKCLPTPNTQDLEAAEDPTDPTDPMEPTDPTDPMDPTDTISTVSTASYKSIIG